MNRVVLRCAAILAATASAWGQSQISWAHHVDASNGFADSAGAMALAPNSNIVVVGASEFAGGGSALRMTASSWSSDGTHQWSTSWQNSGEVDGAGWAVAVASDGSIYAAGHTRQPVGFSTGVVVRYDANGNFLAATLVPFLTEAAAIAIDVSGDVFVAGATRNHTPRHAGVARLTAGLNPVWENSVFHSGPGVEVTGLAIGTAGEVYVSTRTAPTLQCFDASGAIAWTHTFAGGLAFALSAHPAGGAVVAGVISNPSPSVGVVARLTANGVESWRATLAPSGSFGTNVNLLHVDPSGRILAAGSALYASQGLDISAWAIDASGNQAWEARFDCGAGDDAPGALAVAESGDVFVAGYACYTGVHQYDSDLVGWCLDPQGQTKFAEIYAPPQATGFLPGKDIDGCAALPGGGFVLAGEENTFWSGGELDLLVLRADAAVHAECFGFGPAAGCPCANPGALGHGCANSVNPDGALLTGTGFASVSNDSILLSGNGMPNASALYFQGTTLAAVPFGDGERCAGGTVVRLGIEFNASGASQYPAAGDPSVSVRGGVLVPGRRIYQTWYRNAAAYCTTSTFNLTNAVVVDWVP